MPSISLDERDIHYLDEGAGTTPVVFVHAFPLDSRMWDPQIRHLASDFRVVAPDLAGFGASEPCSDPKRCSVDSWADDVIGLCGALGLDHVTVVGASLGADVALAVARRARDLPGALALAGLRPEPAPPDEQRRWAELRQGVAGGGDLRPGHRPLRRHAGRRPVEPTFRGHQAGSSDDEPHVSGGLDRWIRGPQQPARSRRRR